MYRRNVGLFCTPICTSNREQHTMVMLIESTILLFKNNDNDNIFMQARVGQLFDIAQPAG
jgi:hypothetical protein